MNQERPNEARAKRVVERVAGVKLEHADSRGGVDYMSPDGTIAVEVTRVTEKKRIEGRDALQRARKKVTGFASLRTCWRIVLSDLQPGLGTAVQRTLPSLLKLEARNEAAFDWHDGRARIRRDAELEDVYGPLVRAGVAKAWAMPAHGHHAGEHRVIPSLISGGGVGSVDDALHALEKTLADARDNFVKLGSSQARSRHLFVWIDDDTDHGTARALSSLTDGAPGESGVPTRAPQIDASVTALWIVHEHSGRGWLWSEGRWEGIQMTAEELTRR